MKPEEALTMEKLLNELQSVDTVKLVLTGCGESIYESREVYEAIRPFVEKQIPKKPIKDRKQEIRYTSSYSCPSCGGGFIGTGIADYCYHCGQRMDWNVEEFEKEMLEMLEEE